ncbi:MAG: hypothetical protein AAGA37_19930 [Actinomycetota bacterium]
MTEADLQASVIEIAEAHGWRVFHDNDSRMNHAGFPDRRHVAKGMCSPCYQRSQKMAKAS